MLHYGRVLHLLLDTAVHNVGGGREVFECDRQAGSFVSPLPVMFRGRACLLLLLDQAMGHCGHEVLDLGEGSAATWLHDRELFGAFCVSFLFVESLNFGFLGLGLGLELVVLG